MNFPDNIDVANDELNNVPQSTVVKTVMREKLSPSRSQTPNPSMKRSTSGRSIKSDAGKNNGVSPIVQATTPTTNGVSPTKKLPTQLKDGEKSKSAGSPVKSPSKSIKSLPRTPDSGPPSTIDKKKVPMNKVQVGAAPSPNLKTVRSKIGSLDNTSYKPGGGKVKIENRKLDFSKAQPKIAAKNDKYAPSGGDKKITQVKLQWNAKPKVGSLDNATYKPGGGDKKIETVKLDFKDKAKPKVGSKDNAKHVPGGGTVKSTVTPPKTPQELMNNIETQKIEIKAESKVGSMDNMKHKPGGGDKKIFNDRDYLRQTSSNVESVNGSGAQDNVNELYKLKKPNPNPPPSTPTRTRTPFTLLSSSMKSPITARDIRIGLQAKSPDMLKKMITEENSQSPNINLNSDTILTNRLQISTSPSPKTPKSSRSSSAINLKSQDEYSSLSNSRENSPKGFHLPKLNKTMLPDVLESEMYQESTTIKLPKLIETSTTTNKAALA
ncbi:hypothetical protein PV328_011191 [Microctonus aethiopoides]|uniref:Microtubule-associated protein n=1 Tax=Microctonus aethiopoides TaxID=144406 RepID=A0AA39C3Z7_9HYME|nr:hypothetical protein PV328_011191 [Microctonus aethiopoides]